ncbi:transmembrane amino acid transporter protein-domain-containing protein [Aspergillus varians]
MTGRDYKTNDGIEPVESLGPSPGGSVQSLKDSTATYDPVFGEVTAEGPNYRSVGWLGTTALMLKTQIGLGILSIPSVFDTLGIVPGVILLVVIASIATWTSYMVGKFKLNHREVYGIDDAWGLMFGRVGREIVGFSFSLYWIFSAGSGILGLSIAFNAVSSHGTCTAVFVVCAAVIGFLFASIRTLGQISWIAWQVLIVTIAVAVQGRPTTAPEGWTADYKIVGNPSFSQAISAVCTLIFASSATPAYFSLAAEMRDPRYFTRSLVIAQVASTILYLVVGIVVYYYCGSLVASPALGSAGVLFKKISYGVAIPGLIAMITICLHLTSKYVFLRILRGSVHLNSNSFIHWSTWLCCTFGTTVVAYVIASGIPVFDGLVSLIGAFLGVFLAYQPAGCMWFYDNWSKRKTTNRPWLWMLLAGWSVFMIVGGTFMTVSGTYGAIVSIIDGLRKEGSSQPWTCADNSNS